MKKIAGRTYWKEKQRKDEKTGASKTNKGTETTFLQKVIGTRKHGGGGFLTANEEEEAGERRNIEGGPPNKKERCWK